MKRTGIQIALAICCYFLLISCEAESYISRKYACSFRLYTEYHTTCMLVESLDQPQTFVKVSLSSLNGGYRMNATNQQNKSETIILSNEIEKQYYSNMGINLGAKNLIIIGQTTFYGIQAFDGTCPNCSNTPELSWVEKSAKVKCNQCQRVYDLNTSAILEGENGDALMRYYVGYQGRGTLLEVHN